MTARIKICDAVGLTVEETTKIMLEEMGYWQKQGKEVYMITIEPSGDDGEYVVKSSPKQEIKRVRRITGYLSNENNFNDAKRAELRDRVKHNEM